MNKIPSLKTATKRYNKVLAEGKGIHTLPPLYQIVLWYTPISILKVWAFRNLLRAVLTEAIETESETKAVRFAQRYATEQGRSKFIMLLKAIIREQQALLETKQDNIYNG